MKRFVFSLFFYVIVGRWLYAEAILVCPNVVPSIDHLLATVQIPTHNTWSTEKVERAYQHVREMVDHVSHTPSARFNDNPFYAKIDRPLVNTRVMARGNFDEFNDASRSL